MTTIEQTLSTIRVDMAPEFERCLREALALKDRDWLIDQLVRLSLGPDLLDAVEAARAGRQLTEDRAEVFDRLRALQLNAEKLARFIEEFNGMDQAKLVEAGYLLPMHPPKGTEILAGAHRTVTGEVLLRHAKDVVFGLLYGDASTETLFDRCEREILTVTIPRAKAHTMGYLKATTELQAYGTWRDPEAISNDSRADNVLVQIEYGETADEQIGTGIVAALSLINNLEINEQILYAQMVNIEQSTLII